MNSNKKAIVITDTVKTDKKAVVIDDDVLVCRIIGKMLSERKIEPIEIVKGASAERIIRKEGSNLVVVVVDLILPYGPTGWDIIDIIRNNPDTSEVPVIVITGARISSDEITKLKKKVDSVICKKNFDLESFAGILDDLLQVKKR